MMMRDNNGAWGCMMITDKCLCWLMTTDDEWNNGWWLMIDDGG